MACYTYKDLCYSIPHHVEDCFVAENGREPDGDANYDGDYWTLAAMWVNELQYENAALKAQLSQSIPEGYQLVSSEILDRFPELNMSNYDHDGVKRLNDWGIELVLSAAKGE